MVVLSCLLCLERPGEVKWPHQHILWNEALAETWRKTIYQVDGPVRQRAEGILHRENRVCTNLAALILRTSNWRWGKVTYPGSLTVRLAVKAGSPSTVPSSSGMSGQGPSNTLSFLITCPLNVGSQQIISVILDFEPHLFGQANLIHRQISVVTIVVITSQEWSNAVETKLRQFG